LVVTMGCSFLVLRLTDLLVVTGLAYVLRIQLIC
jgi:hypothetical protein